MKLFWRRLAVFVLVAVLLAGGINGAAPVHAKSCAQSVAILVDGRELQTDVPAQIVDSRTLAPLRATFEALGKEVEWEPKTRTVIAKISFGVMRMTIGAKTVTVTTKEGVVLSFELDVSALIINSRTMVPLRFISEMLGALVTWDGPACTVRIVSGKGGMGGFADSEPEESLTRDSPPIERARFAMQFLLDQGYNVGIDVDIDQEIAVVYDRQLVSESVLAQLKESLLWARSSVAALYGIPEISTVLFELPQEIPDEVYNETQWVFASPDAWLNDRLQGTAGSSFMGMAVQQGVFSSAGAWAYETWSQSDLGGSKAQLDFLRWLAHEVGHLGQDQMGGRGCEPMWLLEGEAEYVAMMAMKTHYPEGYNWWRKDHVEGLKWEKPLSRPSEIAGPKGIGYLVLEYLLGSDPGQVTRIAEFRSWFRGHKERLGGCVETLPFFGEFFDISSVAEFSQRFDKEARPTFLRGESPRFKREL